jgi:hypothetical protein
MYANRGKPIAANFRFGFSAMLCDNKQKVETHKLQGRNWMSSFICEECFASKKFEELNCYNHNRDARWRETLIDHDRYLRQTHPSARSTWIEHPGWQLDRNVRDMMHNIFCGGVGNDICGGLVFELCQEGCFEGADSTGRMKMASVRFHDWCLVHKLKLSRKIWTPNHLHDPPSFTTRLKAAYIRYMIFWFAEVAALFAEANRSAHSELRAVSIWSLAKYIQVLNVSGCIRWPSG